MQKPFVITPGDAAGIGPEIIAKAFRDAPELMRGCFVAGDVAVMRRAAGWVGHLPVAQLEGIRQAGEVPPRCVPVLQALPPLAVADLPAPGRVSALAGRMAGEAVQWAARAALRGEVAAVVTAPLHKEALAAAGAPFDGFPGHTELLQAEAAAHAGEPIVQVLVRMMLANDELRVVLVTIHMALREAIGQITQAAVLRTL